MASAMKFCAGRWPDGIRLSAQAYLQSFYESLGFKVIGTPYLEDDIPHIEMLKRFE
jgi:ElaA protein